MYVGGSIQLSINNPAHHKMIEQLSKDLYQDEINHRVLYRYCALTQRQKDMVEDSKTDEKIYETLAQYVETAERTVQDLVECLKNCKVKDERIQFVKRYTYQ